MEEAWELAVVSSAPDFDWSARHTRLRYQAVLSSLAFLMIITLGVKSVQIPGFINFSEKPDLIFIRFGALMFALFSIISFAVQNNLERHLRPMTLKRFRLAIVELDRNLIADDTLLKHFQKAYSKLVKFFNDYEEISNKEQNWSSDAELVADGYEYEIIENEIKSCTSKIYSQLDAFTEFFHPAKPHFMNHLPLFEGIERNAHDAKSILGNLRTKPSIRYNGQPEKVGFLLRDLNFSFHPADQLVEIIGKLKQNFSDFSRVEVNYRFKSYLQTSLLSFVVPALVSIVFVSIGVLKWLR